MTDRTCTRRTWTLPLLLTMGAAALAGCSNTKQQFIDPPNYSEMSARFDKARSLAFAAQTAEKNNKPDEAISLYRQSLEQYREMPMVWNNMGALLLAKGEGMEAASAFRMAGDLSPKDPRPMFNLGVLWEQRGYADEAARYYTLALDRDENYLDALRYSIRLDTHILLRTNDVTARRLQRALLLETDPKWREFFLREKSRIDAKMAADGGNLAQ
ncbi:MAG: tetratricopeptide repeat protein [Phycisphaeraceae bacterium]|nr:tetratricopeptide repeat protein [Phycisphaeraceae bacterium]